MNGGYHFAHARRSISVRRQNDHIAVPNERPHAASSSYEPALDPSAEKIRKDFGADGGRG